MFVYWRLKLPALTGWKYLAHLSLHEVAHEGPSWSNDVNLDEGSEYPFEPVSVVRREHKFIVPNFLLFFKNFFPSPNFNIDARNVDPIRLDKQIKIHLPRLLFNTNA